MGNSPQRQPSSQDHDPSTTGSSMSGVQVEGYNRSKALGVTHAPRVLDWTDFKVILREHWKVILGFSFVIAIIIAIAVVLSVVLKRHTEVIPTTTPFNGPDNINGDITDAPADQFGLPQIINNPISTDTNFGTQLFVHEAGYLCVVTEPVAAEGGQSLMFYQTNITGNLQFQQRLDLFNYLPNNYQVCDGSFAPVFNVRDEIYYLFLSVGNSVSSTDPSANITIYPEYVLLLSFDTTPNTSDSMIWKVQNINADSNFVASPSPAYGGVQYQITALKIPFPESTFVYDKKTPWVGTFGDKLRVVLDDNSTVVKHSLYVRGSEFDPTRPGGNLYWFVLTDSSASPNINLQLVIQDARLLELKNCYDTPSCAATMETVDGKTPCPLTPLLDKKPADYINGFGSDFFVTSGNGKKNVLVVSNPTMEDNCSIKNVPQPPAPKGYVQGYVWDSSGNLGWVQQASGVPGSYNYRYPGTDKDPSIVGGFGSGVLWVDSLLMVAQGSPDSKGNAFYNAYEWTPTPFSASSSTIPTVGIARPGEAAEPFQQTPQYPADGSPSQTYNTVMIPTQNKSNVLFTTWNKNPGDVITLQDPSELGNHQNSEFKTLQNIGASLSSGGGATPRTRFGFGQGTGTWLSRTGLTVRLVTNDPLGDSGRGRIIIWSKVRE